MKKAVIPLLILLVVFSLAACDESQNSSTPNVEEQNEILDQNENVTPTQNDEQETIENEEPFEAEQPEESNGSDESSNNSSENNQPVPQEIPAPVVYTGSGDNVLSIQPPEGIYVLHITGNEESQHFAVKGYDANNEGTELFVNTTDPYDGVTFDPNLATTTLEIKAVGDWTIELVSIYSMPTISAGSTVEGFGDSVILIESYGATATISGNSVLAHFAVKSYGNEGNELLVNTTDLYEGTVMLKEDPFILVINSEGEWAITFN